MQLRKIETKNFRLLHDVSLLLEKKTTVIVGRNNCGKTSLTEVLKRVLEDGTVSFRLEDFSFSAHAGFWEAFKANIEEKGEEEIRQLLPTISVRLTFKYDTDELLGTVGKFVIDTDPDCTEAVISIRYRLKDGKQGDLFSELTDTSDAGKIAFFDALRERIPTFFGAEAFAIDPNDETNSLPLDLADVRRACFGGFIFAQRGLDDISHKDRVVIGRILENLFATAKTNSDDADSHSTAQELELAVKDVQAKIGADFNKKLDALLPAFALFGYPGLSDPQLLTETTFDVARLLSNNTKVRYSGANGVHLPESYNGLGARNIILMLLQLREFFKLYQAKETKPAVHLVFIEEPEVHLHPQMQEVFIRKLANIAKAFSEELGASWPVQFVVTTHSSHIANEAHFETVRYFLAKPDANGSASTIIKDLRKGLSGKPEPDRGFLHQYLTLTRCDLFFADRAVLLEGTAERLLLPKMIAKIDEGKPPSAKLSSQYLSVIEIGGAYAHLFFELIQFLELRTLVITDIDSVEPDGTRMKACPVAAGHRTSNGCLKSWFTPEATPTDLIAATEADKVKGYLRIAYQVPEVANDPCGRSFEDAFMLANPALFPRVGADAVEHAKHAWEEAKGVKKSQFALDHVLSATAWTTPRYITEGLSWLAENPVPPQPAQQVAP
jgi:putative ATP-dependent endonuclease of OLD family